MCACVHTAACVRVCAPLCACLYVCVCLCLCLCLCVAFARALVQAHLPACAYALGLLAEPSTRQHTHTHTHKRNPPAPPLCSASLHKTRPALWPPS